MQRTPKNKRKAVRLTPAQNAALETIAARRGADVSTLLREAAIDYFHLPTDASETYISQVDRDEDGRKAAQEGAGGLQAAGVV